MSAKIQINGVKNLLNKLKGATWDNVIDTALHQGALNIKAWSVKNRLRGPRPKFLGVGVYPAGSGRVGGRLKNSIAVSRNINRNIKEFRIGTNVEYAARHEFGLGIRARPFLRPSIENKNNQQKVLNLLVQNIKKALLK